MENLPPYLKVVQNGLYVDKKDVPALVQDPKFKPFPGVFEDLELWDVLGIYDGIGVVILI